MLALEDMAALVLVLVVMPVLVPVLIMVPPMVPTVPTFVIAAMGVSLEVEEVPMVVATRFSSTCNVYLVGEKHCPV